MQRSILIAAAIALVLSVAADARPRGRVGLAPECGVTMPCVAADGGEGRTLKGYARHHARGGASLKGVPYELASKIREIVAACGARVVSACRQTKIAGTRRWSLHAQCKAVDIAGNPSCHLRYLQGWPGGYTTDYARVNHRHISLDRAGGREMGARFAHGRATISARSRRGRR